MKPIIFTGDSFTFGEGLELYDSNFYDFIKKKYDEKSTERFFYNWPDFENIIAGGSAANVRNELKFSTISSKLLNTLFVSKPRNGGDNLESLYFVKRVLKQYPSESFSCVIMNLTHMFRDGFVEFKKDLTKILKINLENVDSYQLESYMISWFKWDYEQKGIAFNSDNNLFNKYFEPNPYFSIENATMLQNEYKTYSNFEKEAHIKTYKEMINQINEINLPVYFIGHWNKLDNEILHSLNDSEITKYIIDKQIPLEVSDRIYSSISELPSKQPNFFIHQEFPWTDNHHPSKYLHQCIGNSIYKFIKDKYR